MSCPGNPVTIIFGVLMLHVVSAENGSSTPSATPLSTPLVHPLYQELMWLVTVMMQEAPPLSATAGE